MTADAQGNDLTAVKNVVTSKIIIGTYDATKKLTAALIATTVADPQTGLADIFGSDSSAVGLITSDGAPQDARDADDATEFHQQGYTMNADPTLTLAFTVAEDNPTTRKLTIGTPDSDGVYHVRDIVQDTKWFAYQETVYKSGWVRRRLGVIKITGNEPAQDTRGDVSGLGLTATWQVDATVDSGNSRYLQSYYYDGPVAVASVSLTPATATVNVDKTVDLTVGFTPANATDKTFTAVSSDPTKATVAVNGSKVVVTGKAQTDTGKTVTITVTSTDNRKTATCALTVTPKA